MKILTETFNDNDFNSVVVELEKQGWELKKQHGGTLPNFEGHGAEFEKIVSSSDGSWKKGKFPSGIEYIKIERERQISKEGWTAEHDDKHSDGSLSDAAAVYAALPTNIYFHDKQYEDQHRFIELWPWDKDWLKPTPEDRIKELSKAGALIAAEIDRLSRSASNDR